MTWCYPVLDLKEYIVWDGCGFIDPGYFAATGSVHSGADFNIRTGGNTDLGKPIYAMSDGTVTKAEVHRVWGNIVVIYHPEDRVWTHYAHCNEMQVKVGQTVACGAQIGTIGRGGKNARGEYYFYAHLHCEVRVVDLPADDWPSTLYKVRSDAEAYTRRTRRDPVAWLQGKAALTTLAAVQAAKLSTVDVTPPVQKVPTHWAQLRDSATGKQMSGEWISRQQNNATGEIVYFKVPTYKLAQAGVS